MYVGMAEVERIVLRIIWAGAMVKVIVMYILFSSPCRFCRMDCTRSLCDEPGSSGWWGWGCGYNRKKNGNFKKRKRDARRGWRREVSEAQGAFGWTLSKRQPGRASGKRRADRVWKEFGGWSGRGPPGGGGLEVGEESWRARRADGRV